MKKHTFHECAKPGCRVCRGGLGWCIVCGGAESSLPTECPGKRMGPEIEEAVSKGTMDFIDGAWESKQGG